MNDIKVDHHICALDVRQILSREMERSFSTFWSHLAELMLEGVEDESHRLRLKNSIELKDESDGLKFQFRITSGTSSSVLDSKSRVFLLNAFIFFNLFRF